MSRWFRARSMAALLFLLIGGPVAMAQSHGIRGIFPHFDKTLTDISGFKLAGVGFGYDHQTNTPVGFSVEFVVPLIDLSGDGSTASRLPVEYQGFTSEYQGNIKGWTLMYHAHYFLSGTDEGFYMGSFLGVRRVRQQWFLGQVTAPNSYWSNDQGPFAARPEGADLVFPIGVRVGVRGALDGWYQDLYFHAGLQLGAGRLDYREPYLVASAPRTSGFTFGLGYAFGVGW